MPAPEASESSELCSSRRARAAENGKRREQPEDTRVHEHLVICFPISSAGTNRFARAVLLGPDVLCRAAASQVDTPEEAWRLRQSRRVRESYVREVIDPDGDEQALAEIWMLRQSEPVRESYVREVLEPKL